MLPVIHNFQYTRGSAEVFHDFRKPFGLYDESRPYLENNFDFQDEFEREFVKPYTIKSFY